MLLEVCRNMLNSPLFPTPSFPYAIQTTPSIMTLAEGT
jgi:hypothetical protein